MSGGGSGPGRDQRGPMERLVRIAAVLANRGARGVGRDELLKVAGFDGADAASQLSRELRHLSNQGWQIDNIAGPGEDARYRMTTVDNRLRVLLDPEQQTALRRAVLLADRDDLVTRLGLPAGARPTEVEPGSLVGQVGAATLPALSTVARAVRERAVLRFRYKGVDREVHPASLRSKNGTWYLGGVESADLVVGGPVKAFVVARMGDPDAGAPGSAEPVATARHIGLHPMTWEIDPPMDVVLATSPQFEPDVRRWLGEPFQVDSVPGADDADADAVQMTYRVTNRAALRTRLNELGRRVRIVGPARFREEVVAALRRAAGVEDTEVGER